MPLPDPKPGLVISYAYLWRDEARRGQEEGRKDRPSVIVLSVEAFEGETIVIVAPITHRPPQDPDTAIALTVDTKRRLGLDERPSWIVADDLNRFVWPGADLRPIARGSRTYAYGFLPRGLYEKVRQTVLQLAMAQLFMTTTRTAPLRARLVLAPYPRGSPSVRSAITVLMISLAPPAMVQA